MDAEAQSVLQRAATEHQRALRQASGLSGDDFGAILGLGSALLLHSIIEEGTLHPIHPLLDRVVRDELVTDHEAIADGVALLEELLASQPGSADLALLSRALLERMQRHLERDELVLYEPLRRLHLLTV